MTTQTVNMVSAASTNTFALADIDTDVTVATTAASLVSGNLYTGDFTDIPAGNYRIYSRFNAIPIKSDTITLVAAPGTYIPAGEQPSSITYLIGEITHTVVDEDGSSGWPETLQIGDAYTVANGSAFRITLKDAAGNVLTGLSPRAFDDDAEFRFDPIRNISGAATFYGTVTWVAAGSYFLVTIPRSETLKATPNVEYEAQLILWPAAESGIHKRTALRRCFQLLPEIAS